MKRWLMIAILCVLVFPAAMFAQKPPHNVSGKRHPNLSAAQRLVDQAFNRISEAQHANEFDMAGHAEKAKDFLDQANKELKLAAEAANKDRK